MILGKISEIQVDKASWKDKIFLTFDMDWAHEDVIFDTLEILNQYSAKATLFITNDFARLKSLQSNKRYDFGIHPNFNPLLFNRFNMLKARDIVSNSINILDNPIASRSHSITYSSKLLELSQEVGLKYDLNTFIPHQSKIELAPWLTWNNLISVPYSWEDDVALLYGEKLNEKYVNSLIVQPGLKVFNFHPIHIFLNSDSMNLYNSSRNILNDKNKLLQRRGKNFGIRNVLTSILDAC